MEGDGGDPLFCIFCDNRITTTSAAEDCVVEESPLDLSFVKLLCRHLQVPGKEEDELVVCGDCAHLGNCFHDLYFQLEVVKLRLSWMVGRIQGRIKTGNGLEEGKGPKSVQKWRKQLTRACEFELQKSWESGPKVFLTRLDEGEEESAPQKKPKYLPSPIKMEGAAPNVKTELDEDAQMVLLIGTLSFLAVLALSLPQEPPEEQFLVPELRIVTVSSLSTLQTEDDIQTESNPSPIELAGAEDHDKYASSPSQSSPPAVAQETEQMEVVQDAQNEEDDDDIQIIEPEPYHLPNPAAADENGNNYEHQGLFNTFTEQDNNQQQEPPVLEETQTPFYHQNQYQPPSSLEAPPGQVNIRDYPTLRNILIPQNPSDNVNLRIPPVQNNFLLPYQQPTTNYPILNSTRQILEASVRRRVHANTHFPPVLPQTPAPNINPFAKRGEPRSRPPYPNANSFVPIMEPPAPPPPPPNVNPFAGRNNIGPPPLIPIPPGLPPVSTSCTTSTLNHSCEVCHKSYSSAAEVGRHRVIRHNLPYFVRCDGCSSIFGTELGLKKHQKNAKFSTCNPDPERHGHQEARVPPAPPSVNQSQAAPPPKPSAQPILLPPPVPVMRLPPSPPQPVVVPPIIQPRFPPISPQECEICRTRFLTKNEVEQHRQEAHLLQYAVRCEVCGSSFQTRSGLELHQQKNKSSNCNPNPEKPPPPPSLPTPSIEPEVVEIVQPPRPQISWRILTENMPPPGPMPPEAVLAPPQVNWRKRKRPIQTSGTVPLALPKCGMCDEYFNSTVHLLIHLRVVHKRGQEHSSEVKVINLD